MVAAAGTEALALLDDAESVIDNDCWATGLLLSFCAAENLAHMSEGVAADAGGAL